ncbi:MAG: hypothetical protein FJ249_06400 [Nitrospira sp.]|nr:hypothetical protein [Nitrospira sp.]
MLDPPLARVYSKEFKTFSEARCREAQVKPHGFSPLRRPARRKPLAGESSFRLRGDGAFGGGLGYEGRAAVASCVGG